jgi:hypothetical protein
MPTEEEQAVRGDRVGQLRLDPDVARGRPAAENAGDLAGGRLPGPGERLAKPLDWLGTQCPDILEQSTCFQPKAVSHGRLQTSYRAEA